MKKVDKSIMFWYGMANNGKNEFPAVTIASRFNPEDNTVSRGIAVLSPNDNPSREAGRRIALKRLALAEFRQKNCLPINWEASKIVNTSYSQIIDKSVPRWEFKCQFHVPMEKIENRVFLNPNKKK